MERSRQIRETLIMLILLGSFLFCGSGKEAKASGTEDTITLPIDGIKTVTERRWIFTGRRD